MAFTKDNITFSDFTNNAIHMTKTANGHFSGVAVNKIAAGLGGLYMHCVQIDWNGAQLPNADPTTGGQYTITHTSSLLSLINEMQKEIYTLTAAVIALSNK